MSGFGIVRKVDELGRIVIPKEIRKVLDIKTGSSIEININENQELVLKKFSEVKNSFKDTGVFLDSFFSIFQIPVLLCDEKSVVYSIGVNKKEFVGKEISEELLNLDSRESKFFNGNIVKEQTIKYNDSLIVNIYNDGYMCGKIILLKKEGMVFGKEVIFCLNLIVEYITRILNFE